MRYYSNIVGVMALRAEGLWLLAVCPFPPSAPRNGPVWTENIAKVIGIYDKLSRYAADEGVVIAHGSMYGNTEQDGEAIAAELSVQGIKNIVMHNVSKSNPLISLPTYLASRTYHRRPHLQQTRFILIESLPGFWYAAKGRDLGYFWLLLAGGCREAHGRVCRKEQVRDCGDLVDEAGHEGHYFKEQCGNLAMRHMAERLKKDRS